MKSGTKVIIAGDSYEIGTEIEIAGEKFRVYNTQEDKVFFYKVGKKGQPTKINGAYSFEQIAYYTQIGAFVY